MLNNDSNLTSLTKSILRILQANRNWLNDLRKTLLDMGVDLSNQKPSDDTLIYKRLGFEVNF